MNIDNGHLVSLTKFFDLPDDEENKAQDLAERLKAQKDSMEKEMKAMQERGYTEVPKELETAAKKKLAGKAEAYVSLTSGGKLSKWAAKQRKAKRKIAAESRKKNRR